MTGLRKSPSEKCLCRSPGDRSSDRRIEHMIRTPESWKTSFDPSNPDPNPDPVRAWIGQFSGSASHHEVIIQEIKVIIQELFTFSRRRNANIISSVWLAKLRENGLEDIGSVKNPCFFDRAHAGWGRFNVGENDWTPCSCKKVGGMLITGGDPIGIRAPMGLRFDIFRNWGTYSGRIAKGVNCENGGVWRGAVLGDLMRISRSGLRVQDRNFFRTGKNF